jgi:hypothetical protein
MLPGLSGESGLTRKLRRATPTGRQASADQTHAEQGERSGLRDLLDLEVDADLTSDLSTG